MKSNNKILILERKKNEILPSRADDVKLALKFSDISCINLYKTLEYEEYDEYEYDNVECYVICFILKNGCTKSWHTFDVEYANLIYELVLKNL